jgi:UDP-N-acetylglucosamine/UDP-N-acetylgalactosamine diphosphorylase
LIDLVFLTLTKINFVLYWFNLPKHVMMTSSFLDYFKQFEPQIFRFWPELSQDQQKAFENQLKNIDLETLERQKQLLQKPLVSIEEKFESFEGFTFAGNQDLFLRGKHLIEEGRLGCLLLAGGQGTRLQFSGPKGIYPISVIKHKSLFQLCVEKVAAASAWVNRPLNLAIMTSPNNDEETRSFFHQHDYFGLNPSQIDFFMQGTLPLLNPKGELFLQTPWQISTGADGNGNSLLYLAQSGILDRWIQQGIEFIHLILVDNPLADPFDAQLVGFHHQQEVDITVKCTEKQQADEKVGTLVKKNGQCCIVEYSEMPNKEKNEKKNDGLLKHRCANLSLFCFSISFIKRMLSERHSLPLHRAWKAAQYIDEKGNSHLPSKLNVWKFETFIFDWLLYTHKVAALLYPRDECFAPLKNLTGHDSPASVQQALLERDKKTIQSLTGQAPPSFPFELAADFYYPSMALISKWKGRTITTPYVNPE